MENFGLINKEEKLRNYIKGFSKTLTAFSGGVDSALVAFISATELGERALAVLADSASLKRDDLRLAKDFCRLFSMQLQLIETSELANWDYVANTKQRCYYCKQTLYEAMLPLKKSFDAEVIFNGANLDDMNEYRPGMQAASVHGVRSPLQIAGFAKKDVRALAEKLGLPNFQKPASPCLASRIAHRIPVTKERLLLVEQAEAYLNNFYKSYAPKNLRVRLLPKLKAGIEIEARLLPVLQKDFKTINKKLLELKFSSVQLKQYQLGGA